MLRPRAVRSILFDDVAGVRPDPASGDDPVASLQRARRRALLVAGLDWIAIAALFLARPAVGTFLEPGPTEQGLFTLAVLAVATHSGFRLGQAEKYGAVTRALEALPEESPADWLEEQLPGSGVEED